VISIRVGADVDCEASLPLSGRRTAKSTLQIDQAKDRVYAWSWRDERDRRGISPLWWDKHGTTMMTVALLSDRMSATQKLRPYHSERERETRPRNQSQTETETLPFTLCTRNVNIQRGKVQHALKYMGIWYAKRRDLTEQMVKRKDMTERITTAPSQPDDSLHTHQLHREVFLFSAIASLYGSCLPFNPISSL